MPKEKEFELLSAPKIKSIDDDVVPIKGKKKQSGDVELDRLIASIEKAFGRGSVMMMSDSPVRDIQVISSRSIGLNRALGVGGYPRGRIIELAGPESSGKTTLALHAMAEAQSSGGRVAIIDAEHALDIKYAQALGVDTDELLLSQPDYGEQGLSIAEELVKSGLFSIVVIDSIPAMTPRVEIEGDMGDSHVGLLARMMSQGIRKLTSAVSQTQTLLIMINQVREKIGVLFGPKEGTPGGRQLKHAFSVRVDIRKAAAIKSGDKIIGNNTKVKIVKNKMAPPFKTAEFDIYYGKGISRVGEVIDYGVQYGLIQKAGAFYSYNDDRLGQGRSKAITYLEENPDIADEIEERLYEEFKKEDS